MPDPGLGPRALTYPYHHLASVPFSCSRVTRFAVGASGKPGPQAPVEGRRCHSRSWRPHSRLGNSETKVPASNCLLSKAQPASSATGVRGKLMSLSGGEGWGSTPRGLCYLGKQANRLITLGRWPLSPSVPIYPAVTSPVIQWLVSPQPQNSVGLPGSSLDPSCWCWVCPFPHWASLSLFTQEEAWTEPF